MLPLQGSERMAVGAIMSLPEEVGAQCTVTALLGHSWKGFPSASPFPLFCSSMTFPIFPFSSTLAGGEPSKDGRRGV